MGTTDNEGRRGKVINLYSNEEGGLKSKYLFIARNQRDYSQGECIGKSTNFADPHKKGLKHQNVGVDSQVDRQNALEIDTKREEGVKKDGPICHVEGCVVVVKRFFGVFLGSPSLIMWVSTSSLLILQMQQPLRDTKY